VEPDEATLPIEHIDDVAHGKGIVEGASPDAHAGLLRPSEDVGGRVEIDAARRDDGLPDVVEIAIRFRDLIPEGYEPEEADGIRPEHAQVAVGSDENG